MKSKIKKKQPAEKHNFNSYDLKKYNLLFSGYLK
jgi:hypothetical protein